MWSVLAVVVFCVTLETGQSLSNCNNCDVLAPLKIQQQWHEVYTLASPATKAAVGTAIWRSVLRRDIRVRDFLSSGQVGSDGGENVARFQGCMARCFAGLNTVMSVLHDPLQLSLQLDYIMTKHRNALVPQWAILPFKEAFLSVVSTRATFTKACYNQDDWQPFILGIIKEITPKFEDNGRSVAEPQVCMTRECVKTASRIIEAMDFNVNPCNDFFEYACGSWNRKNVIPDDRPNINTFRKLGDELQAALKSLLEEEVKTDEEPLAIVNAKYLYESCQNMNLIEERGDVPLKNLINQLGGWPVLDPLWDQKPFDFVDLMGRLRLLNNRVLVNLWVSSDDKQSDVNIIQLDQGQLGMPSRDYFLKGRDDKPIAAYENFAIDIAKVLGADHDRAEKEMKEMVDFEIRLANITIPSEERRDTEAIYNKFTIAELSTNLTSEIDWLKYLRVIFANVSITINETEHVVVYSPSYMTELATLLRDTDARTVGNYMMWRIVMNRVSNMPQRYLDLRRDFNKALYGTDRDRARWRTCVNYVNDNFGMAVGRMFVKAHFAEKAKANALEMIHNIRRAFNALLEEVPWMDQATRQVARQKADSIQEKIGFPNYIMNDTALNADYEGIVSDPKTYFENVLNNLNVATKINLQNLRLPVDKTRWSTTPAVVNAFYSSTKNQIMFPAGILQPPFYHESYPKSLNYGGIAMVIGHEITHGFDDKGRQFDKDGNLKQWWSDSVIKKFKERAQCIIDQYSNYTVPEVSMNLNGKQTQGENIADNGGLKQAFRAYRSWVDIQGHEEDLLPGIDLSHNQLFFLNFAQIWCGSARPESYLQAIRSGRHSPGRFRVAGSLSNSREFAEAFSCPVGSPMNPEKKCSVW